MKRMPRGVAAALVVAGVMAGPAHAAPSTDAVVGEVYGGGGNAGATLKNDFVELEDLSGTAVDLTGKSVQYLPALPGADSTWGVTALSGSLPASGPYLVRGAAGGGGTTALPTPDASGSTNLSGTAGTVALVTGTAPLTCKTTADCAADGRIVDLVGYGTATVREATAAPAGSNTTSVARPGGDTDVNGTDFTAGAPTPRNAAGEGPMVPPPVAATVEGVQGTGFVSPLAGRDVTGVTGVVTAVRTTGSARGFWLQQVAGRDGDDATSPGVLVFTGSTSPGVAVGDSVSVAGTVTEYRAAAGALSTTEITSPTVSAGPTGTVAPQPVVVGPGGRVPPGSVFSTFTGDVETKPALTPATSGLDFWESLEGVRITVRDPEVVGPTNGFGETTVVLGGAGPRTPRGGILVTPDDFNPERLKLEAVAPATVPGADVGDRFAGTVTGVVDYDFGNPTLLATATPALVDGALARETTATQKAGELAVATFNVENLDPGDPQATFDALADQIVGNLAAPDILALEEVQDDNGATDDGTVTSGATLAKLTAAITAEGGPAYAARSIDPVNKQDGGEPGGNIRQAFLFRTDRGLTFTDRPGGDATTPVTVGDGPALSVSPGRVDPAATAWNSSRKPLAGEFRWQGKPLFVVANHFNSKGGDEGLFGRNQPPARSSETQRRAQATAVRGFVDAVQAKDPAAGVVVLGDLNDFEFSDAVDVLTAGGALVDLPRTLPARERYTYVFEGNSQVLDHIVLSRRLAAGPYDYDVVHTNAEFADQISDHDPQVVRLGVPAPDPAPSPTPSPSPTPGPSPAPTATPVPSPVPPAATPRPRLQRVAKTITRRAKRLTVTVACRGPKACRGSVVVTRRPGGARIGSASFRAASGTRVRVRIPLRAKRLQACRELRVTLRSGGRPVATASVRVLRRR